MKLIVAALVLSVATISAVPALADIFRHDDGESGVISFTDTPASSQYTLIMRERQPARTDWKQKITRKPAESRPASPEQATNRGNAPTDLPIEGVLTSPVGYRIDPFNGRLRHHNGQDIAAPTGTPVKPVAPGTVVYSGWRSGYGNTVVVEHDDGMLTLYAHHSSNLVTEGSRVERNTVIALTGSTGRSTGPHLHFEAWRDGINITSSFVPSSGSAQQSQRIASAPIRRYLQEDGTLLFTNLR